MSSLLLQASQCQLQTLQRPCAGRCPRVATARPQRQVVCSAEPTLRESIAQRVATAGAALCLTAGITAPAIAGEFDLLGSETPTNQYLIDDAGVLNKTTRKSLNNTLTSLESRTGYRLEAVTIRKLEFENDAFALGDKVIEKWYPTKEQGDKKGILLVVTTGKDGAVTGGGGFLRAVGDELIDSIISENIPTLTEAEKFNEALTSCVARIEAKLTGQKVPPPPSRNEQERVRTYKTKSETNNQRTVFTTIVAVLLVIAFVVPMLQFYGYTSKN